jgi:hypothetical protein
MRASKLFADIVDVEMNEHDFAWLQPLVEVEQSPNAHLPA